ncbi:hypothetical protein FS837_007542 [Tulasnella sp. UAMH 9824]|nr:hypothetical protein FS837_007542 [Tulasnella sp. UAMH 9824]
MASTEPHPPAISNANRLGTSRAPPRTVGWAELPERSRSSWLPPRPDWARAPGRMPVNNNVGPRFSVGDKPLSLKVATGSNRPPDFAGQEAEVARRTVGDPSQAQDNTHPDHKSENQTLSKSVSSLGSRDKSMLQECFSDCSSSVYSGGSSNSARGIGALESIAERSSNFSEDDPLFQTVARLEAIPIFRTADGVTIRFPQYAAHQLLSFSDPEEIQAVLNDLLDLTVNKQISDEWIMGMVWHPPLLKAVFRLVDTIVPTNKLLSSKSVCGRVLEALLTRFPPRFILFQLAGRSLDVHGAVGIRYLISRNRFTSGTAPQNFRVEELLTAAGAIHHACKIVEATGMMPPASVQAIRLVEYVLREITSLEQLHDGGTKKFVKAIIVLLKNKNIRRPGERSDVDPARRVAALHLISTLLRTYKRLMERLDEESDTPNMPHEDWLLQDLGVSDVFDYLGDGSAEPMVRCMALRVIRDFAVVDPGAVALWGSLGDIVGISVDVLLWKTEWQQGHNGKAKSLEIAKFNPLDNAYQIIALSPPALTIATVSKGFAVDDTYRLVEPLLDFIVDHSTSQDKSWPLVLSTLLQSGLFSLLLDILREPFTMEGDSLCRSTSRTKADACICLTRCLEQAKAKDMKMLPATMRGTLEDLARNQDLLLNLREAAMNGLHALNDNVLPSIVRSQSVPPRPDSIASSTTNSTPTSPQPNSAVPRIDNVTE